MRAFLLRLVICSFLISLCCAIVTEEKLRRIVRFAGGCLLAVIVLQPLMRFRLNTFSDKLFDFALPRGLQESAEEKNTALLRNMIEEQTAERISERADLLGFHASVSVTAEEDEASGLILPYEVTIAGVCTQQQQKKLTEYIETELNIPAIRQRWVIG